MTEPPDSEGEDQTLAQDGLGFSGKPSPKKTVTPIEQGTVTEKPGDTIGPYKLLQQIGEGGFGVVYMAEQSKPVKRRVALKIIKPGMDTKEVIARFEAERQALALMDHPHIAKVLDVGATETGRPFFAMELVKGVSITEYCDTHRLDTRQRLVLFRDVCGAVQHAHQKGVIHRDIKPSNILVTHHDTTAVVKVIDFGVAKAISQELTEKTLFTAFGQMIGTLHYMSPEQSEMSGLDVDTRSDIYSLGVVLYELLTGRTPIDPKHLREAGLEEVHRIIREQEPARPSTRLTSLENDEITAIAKAHSEPPEKLSRSVRGDLDWIVMKALDKDRTRRYETATGFAEDIRRYLDDEAVLASPPSSAYRLGKFARRNKAALATTSVILVTLITAVAVSTWQAKVAWEAQKGEAEQRELAEANAREAAEKAAEAEQSAEEAKAVLAFFQDKVLAAARPREQAGGLGIDATIFEAIDSAEPGIERAFADRPLVKASIRSALGLTYEYLGLAKRAISQQERTLELRQKLLGPEHPRTLLSMGILANSYRAAGRLDEALTMNEETLELRKKVLGREHPDTLRAMSNLAIFYNTAGRNNEALALKEETLELRKKVLGPEHPDTLSSMNSLAISYRTAGRNNEALALKEETLELRKKVLGPEHPDTLSSISSLAHSYRTARRFEDAESLFREWIVIREKQGTSDWRFFYAQSSLGSVLTEQKKYAEAEPMLLAGHNGLETTDPKAELKYLKLSIGRLVNLYTDWGRPKEAANWQAKLDASERAAVTPGASDYRLFTDVFGQQTEARIVNVENGQVMLEKRDGNTLMLPLKSLPENEQKAVAEFEARN